MVKKLVGIAVVGFLLMPVAAWGANKSRAENTTTCVPLPVATDAKDIHVGGHHYHVAARSDINVCVTLDNQVQGTPTVTRYDNCGNTCFAVRVADVRAYSDVKVEVTHKEDGNAQSIGVDPNPIDLTGDIDEVCVSSHSAGSPDPCVMTITSPSDLRAKGGSKQVSLTWTEAKEAYGRDLETTYELWRSTSEELETFEQVATSSTTSFVDSGLKKKTTYYYFVVAVDENGKRSGGSNMASATTSS